jgi:hypothetical protein
MSGLKLIDGPMAESFAVVSFLLYGWSTFNDRANVQEQLIGRFCHCFCQASRCR